MKKIILFYLTLPLISCQSLTYKPLSPDLRTSEKILETSLSSKEAFQRVSAYLAKNLGDSNEAIKIRDESLLLIVSKIVVPCNELSKDPFNLMTASPLYTTQINFKDKRVKVSAIAEYYFLSGSNTNKIEIHEGNIKTIQSCSNKVFDHIDKALNSASSSDSW